MKLPNKIYTYKESVIHKFPIVLDEIKKYESIDVITLYGSLKKKFDNTVEFLEVMDCLYVIGAIEYDFDFRRISYVAKNRM